MAVSAWSAGVGQHLNGLQMENTPRRQKAYSVNRMKMASGTREYITCDHNIVKLKSQFPCTKKPPSYLALEPPEIELRDGDVGVEVRHPARELAANLSVVLEEF